MSVPRTLKAVEGAEKSRAWIPCDVPSLQALSSQAGLFSVSDGCLALGGGPVRTSLLGGRGEAEMTTEPPMAPCSWAQGCGAAQDLTMASSPLFSVSSDACCILEPARWDYLRQSDGPTLQFRCPAGTALSLLKASGPRVLWEAMFLKTRSWQFFPRILLKGKYLLRVRQDRRSDTMEDGRRPWEEI